MQTAVLAASDSWYLQDLQRAGGNRFQVTPVSYKQLASHVDARRALVRSGDVDLGVFDALLVRSMPPGSLEQVVFRMVVLAQLEMAGVAVVNPPRAIEAAVDKYLATSRLSQAGLLVPQTFACQTAEAGLAAFEQLGGDVVVKPIFGSEGRGIVRLTDLDVAFRVLRSLEQMQAVLYLQEFIEHEGCDFRLFTIGDQTLGMRRCNRLDWRTNVGRGAEVQAVDVSPEWQSLALRAANAVGALVAGVDLLPGRDGQLYVLEVNAVPGWRALARATNVDVARCILEFAEQQVNSQA